MKVTRKYYNMLARTLETKKEALKEWQMDIKHCSHGTKTLHASIIVDLKRNIKLLTKKLARCTIIEN